MFQKNRSNNFVAVFRVVNLFPKKIIVVINCHLERNTHIDGFTGAIEASIAAVAKLLD
jgi:hypothetical protein